MNAPSPTPPAQSASILVAENDSSVRDLLRTALEEAGFLIIVCAQAAEEARSHLRRTSTQLALVDLGLPGLSGLEALTEPRNRALKVIAISLEDTPEAMLRALRQRAYDYFTKPFDRQLIAERVQQALSDPAAEIEVLSARPDWLELRVPCQWAAAERASGFIARMAAGLPDEIREGVGTAARELLLNAVEWGGQLDPGKKVRIACVRGSRMLMYRIADPGPGFRMEDVPHAAIGYADGMGQYDVVRQQRGMRPGGLGLMLVRALADELIYNEAGNEVIFVKYLA